MGIVAGDLATRFLLKTRPYETCPGDTDAVFEKSVADSRRSHRPSRPAARAEGPCRGRRPDARPRPFPSRPGALRQGAPADRPGRRDILPAQHLQQRRRRPPNRAARRRMLALGHLRVGLVHQPVARNRVGPRPRPLQHRLPQAQAQKPGAAQVREGADGSGRGGPQGLRGAARHRRGPRRRRAIPATPGSARRDGRSAPANRCISIAKVPTASSTSARSRA